MESAEELDQDIQNRILMQKVDTYTNTVCIQVVVRLLVPRRGRGLRNEHL